MSRRADPLRPATYSGAVSLGVAGEGFCQISSSKSLPLPARSRSSYCGRFSRVLVPYPGRLGTGLGGCLSHGFASIGAASAST